MGRWGYKSKVGMEDANWRRLLKCGCNLIHHHHSTHKTIVCATGLIIWLFENEIESAEKYAEIARESDSYNPAAFVNLGNCHFQRGDVEKAKVCNHTKWSVWKVLKKILFNLHSRLLPIRCPLCFCWWWWRFCFRSCTWWRWTMTPLV